MESKAKVSEAVVRRLPAYYRYLEELEKDGITRISSQELSALMSLTASQIRQDINCFGALGQQGYGYHVAELRQCIGDILGLNKTYRVIIVGAGNIGSAVANYHGFLRLDFIVDALFDIDPRRVGGRHGDAPVLPASQLPGYLQDNPIDIGVIATPADAAREVASTLMDGGVRAIWNFSPVDISVPIGFSIQNVQLTDSLLVLTYHMKND